MSVATDEPGRTMMLINQGLADARLAADSAR